MLYVLLGIVLLCALLGVVELFVWIWDKADRRLHTADAAVNRQAKPAVILLPACLPDRESIKNIYSLSDHFADRFTEVVHS